MARYIDADKLIADGWHLERHAPNGRCLTMMSIADSPTADVVEMKHGYWIGQLPKVPKCSVCGAIDAMKGKYCRYCGAKMDGERSEDTE